MRVCLQAYFGCASAPDGTIYAAGGHDGTSFLSSCQGYILNSFYSLLEELPGWSTARVPSGGASGDSCRSSEPNSCRWIA